MKGKKNYGWLQFSYCSIVLPKTQLFIRPHHQMEVEYCIPTFKRPRGALHFAKKICKKTFHIILSISA